MQSANISRGIHSQRTQYNQATNTGAPSSSVGSDTSSFFLPEGYTELPTVEQVPKSSFWSKCFPCCNPNDDSNDEAKPSRVGVESTRAPLLSDYPQQYDSPSAVIDASPNITPTTTTPQFRETKQGGSSSAGVQGRLGGLHQKSANLLEEALKFASNGETRHPKWHQPSTALSRQKREKRNIARGLLPDGSIPAKMQTSSAGVS